MNTELYELVARIKAEGPYGTGGAFEALRMLPELAKRLLEVEAERDVAKRRLDWAKENRSQFKAIGDGLWRGYDSYDEAIDAAIVAEL